MPRMKRGSAVDGFVFWLKTQGLAQATIKNYTTQVRAWLQWCEEAHINPQTATTVLMMNWLGFYSTTHLPSTVRLATITLRVYYDYLKSVKAVKRNAARDIGVKKQITRPVAALQVHEVKQLIGACETLQDRAMLLLMIGGGLRRSEVLNITREDVDFEHGTIRIFGKGSKWREVAPGTMAMEAVKMAMGWRPRVFDNTHPDSLRRRLAYLTEKAGIDKRVHPHMFRYYFATTFCEQGGGIDLLQTILGHSSLEMSMYYSRAGREKRALAAQVRYNPADALMA